MREMKRHMLQGHRLIGAILVLVVLATAWFSMAIPSVAQDEDGYELTIQTTLCSEQPPRPPTFEGADCQPAEGVMMEVFNETGEPLGACTTVASAQFEHVATCTVVIPYDTRVLVYQDASTLPAGYELLGPKSVTSPPDASPPTALYLPPLFVNLPIDNTTVLVEALIEKLTDILREILA